jgi:hypothetical protein
LICGIGRYDGISTAESWLIGSRKIPLGKRTPKFRFRTIHTPAKLSSLALHHIINITADLRSKQSLKTRITISNINKNKRTLASKNPAMPCHMNHQARNHAESIIKTFIHPLAFPSCLPKCLQHRHRSPNKHQQPPRRLHPRPRITRHRARRTRRLTPRRRTRRARPGGALRPRRRTQQRPSPRTRRRYRRRRGRRVGALDLGRLRGGERGACGGEGGGDGVGGGDGELAGVVGDVLVAVVDDLEGVEGAVDELGAGGPEVGTGVLD